MRFLYNLEGRICPWGRELQMDEGSGGATLQHTLARSRQGDRSATDVLMRIAYDELHRLAERFMRGERNDHTLQATALLNEAYIRLFAQQNVDWVDRNHFIAVAAEIMRRVLVDYARGHKRNKRGNGRSPLSIDTLNIPIDGTDNMVDIEQLSDALDRLSQLDERMRRVVELKFFAGLGNEEVADVLAVSRATVANDWTVAKAWLRADLSAGGTSFIAGESFSGAS